jgi:hypothetical protein
MIAITSSYFDNDWVRINFREISKEGFTITALAENENNILLLLFIIYGCFFLLPLTGMNRKNTIPVHFQTLNLLL